MRILLWHFACDPRRPSCFGGTGPQFALDQEGPVSSEDSVSSGASPTDFSTAVMEALVVPFALVHGGPASSEEAEISDGVVAPCFAVPGSRASTAEFAAAEAAALVVSFDPGPA